MSMTVSYELWTYDLCPCSSGNLTATSNFTWAEARTSIHHYKWMNANENPVFGWPSVHWRCLWHHFLFQSVCGGPHFYWIPNASNAYLTYSWHHIHRMKRNPKKLFNRISFPTEEPLKIVAIISAKYSSRSLFSKKQREKSESCNKIESTTEPSVIYYMYQLGDFIKFIWILFHEKDDVHSKRA